MKVEATVHVENNCAVLPIPATVDGIDQTNLAMSVKPIQSGTHVQITEEHSALITQPRGTLDGKTLDVVKVEGHPGWYIKTAFLF